MQLNAETHAKKGLKTCLYGLSNFNFLNSEKKDENFIFVNLIEEILAQFSFQRTKNQDITKSYKSYDRKVVGSILVNMIDGINDMFNKNP